MKKYIAIIISIIPINILRIFLYNILMKYKISYSSKIGLGTILSANTVIINKANIGRFNRIIGEFDLTIDEHTNIGNSNEFVNTYESRSSAYCKIGKKVHITNNHFFDTSGGLIIKNFNRIAGRGSQFWTHGGQKERCEIVINEKCYIGSAVRISQGVEISENSFIGLGSVVSRTFNKPDVLIFGNPAKIVKEGISARKSLNEI